MSDRADDESAGDQPPLVALLRERFEGATLFGLAAFMLWVRMQSYEHFVKDGEVLFSGNDPYYHLRQVSYTVRHWPATMPYDPWTYYPYGTNSNQFGTLYDQLVATAALVVGLGDPSQTLVAKTLAVSPAVIGALLVFPAYYAGKRVGGTYGGLFGAGVLALLPGSILSRTLVGSADHQAIEALAQMTAVLALLVALGVAKEEKPVYELVLDRDYAALRRPVGWSAVAGVAMGLYVWTWPPAVLLIAIVGAFFAVKMSADYYHGSTPEPMAFVAVVSMTVTGVLAMLPTTALTFSPTTWGPLQPAAAFGVAAGAVFLSWLAREWDDRDLDRSLYPVTVGAIALVGAVVVSVALPDVWSTLSRNFQRILGFSAGAGTRTIREAQPFLGQVNPGVISAVEVVMFEYGLMLFTALVAMGIMLAKPLFYSAEREDHVTLVGGLAVVAVVWEFGVGEMLAGVLPVDVGGVLVETFVVGAVLLVAMVRGDHDAEELFVSVWTLFLIAAAFTQVRFNYYLALAVVVLNAYLLREFLEYVAVVRPDGSVVDEVEPYQMMAVMLAVLVVLPVLVMPVPYYERSTPQGGTQTFDSSTAIEIGNGSYPRGFNKWEDTLEWMNRSTPKEGQYGGASNPMAYYGTYEATDDFTYAEGTYGVMSWWDYGHWITIEGRRIPDANPFQQGATRAANFLLAPNETRANAVLERGMGEHEETRYVVIDSQMADPYGKFSAPTVFYTDANVSYVGDFVSPYHYSLRRNAQGQVVGGRPAFRLLQQRYYESMMIRLFMFNASRASVAPVVVDWTVRNGTRVIPRNGSLQDYRRFGPRGMAIARQQVKNDTTGPPNTSAIGGIGHFPREPVPALEHYRLVRTSNRTVKNTPSFLRQVSRVKVFEKVPGATIRGHGPPNTTVQATVVMALESRNDTFRYTQRARTGEDGTFTMTVPYSTTGYDNWGVEEGYTDVSVRATGPYKIATGLVVKNNSTYVYSASVNVSEAHVIGENTSTITVDLERRNFSLTRNGSAVRSLETRAPADALSDEVEVASPDTTTGGAPVTDGGAPAAVPRGRLGGAVDRRAPARGGGAGTGAVPGWLPQWLVVALLVGAAALEVRDDRVR